MMMQKEFRLIDTGINTPSMNMAIDEALLSSKEPVLRFYRWKPPGLSIGYFQHMQQINKDYCKQNNIQIVRRLTGGNAVLHNKELTYSFIIDEKEMSKSVIESYKKISKGILAALTSLGLNAKMNDEVNKDEKSAVCFNDTSWYELIVNKKKLVGSAQKRINKKILQHGAILVDVNIEKYANCFNNCNHILIQKLKQRMTGVNQELKKEIKIDELKNSLIQGFKKELNLEFKESKLTKEEITLANKLNKEKYDKDDWNFKL